MIHALLDGDWVLYAAGFAGQRTQCVYVDQDENVVIFGDNMTAIKKELGEDIAFDGRKLFKREVVDPENFFFHTAKSMIEAQVEKIRDKFEQDVKLTVMLDGDGNFRSRLATIKPYKGTRSAHSKPLMFNNIRQYLLDVWNAEVIYDQETDDALAIRQTRDSDTIIVAVDKDMLQVPGYHLNPNKGFKRVSEQEGELRLYVQAAMGDSVDNIGGAKGCGPAAARKAFELDMSEDFKWAKLVSIYQKSIDKHGDVYGGLTAEEAALENMRLVYLRRQEDEIWLPPNKRK